MFIIISIGASKLRTNWEFFAIASNEQKQKRDPSPLGNLEKGGYVTQEEVNIMLTALQVSLRAAVDTAIQTYRILL